MARTTLGRASTRKSGGSRSATKPRGSASRRHSSVSVKRIREGLLGRAFGIVRRSFLGVSSLPRSFWGFVFLVGAAAGASSLWIPGSGALGERFRGVAFESLGATAAATPLIALAIGVELLRERGRPTRTAVCSGLLVCLAASLAEVTASGETRGVGGGRLGKAVEGWLLGLLGRPGSIVVLVAAIALVLGVGFRLPIWEALGAGIEFLERRRLRLDGLDKSEAHVTSPSDGKSGPLPRGAGVRITLADAADDDMGIPGVSHSVSSQAHRGGKDVVSWDTAVGGSSDREGGHVVGPGLRRPPGKSARRGGAEKPSQGDSGKEQKGRAAQLALSLGRSGVLVPPTEFELPALDLLRQTVESSQPKAATEETGRVLVETLAQFDVEASLSGITVGPTVTRFEVELAPGVKVAKVKTLADDIAYALAAESVRIQAPIPGKSAVGIEIPNRERRLVTLGDVLVPGARRLAHPLDCALGKDIAGKPVFVNLSEMPHLLIAGTTGGGKSSTINALVSSLIMRNGPEQVRLLLVDPKRVELGVYDGIPHLLTRVVTEPKRAAEALDWVVREMELRYAKLAELGARDMAGYNRLLFELEGEVKGESFEHSPLPFVVVVVDELNDLMMVAARDVEDSIMRLAQMARAVGIHLVVATQRPSTNVITGVIKANIPSRIAFKVGSQVDSRVILDTGGAEDLVGMGDMLLVTATSGVPRRIQGCYVSEDEVRKIVAHWRRQVPKPHYLDEVVFSNDSAESAKEPEVEDELFDRAVELVVKTQLGSTSMLQRKLRIGFARAGRLMDLLERRGIVGPAEGSKARAVLVSPDDWERLRGARSVDQGFDQNQD